MTFPHQVMTGIAGLFTEIYTKRLESPSQFFYMSFLTILGNYLSTRVRLEGELAQDPRMYMLLLGDSGDSHKSTAIIKAADFFKRHIPVEYQYSVMNYGPGSAEGFQRCVSENPDKNILVVFDEFKQFVAKATIKNSVLLPCFTTLFESDHYENHTGQASIIINNARLSLLAASTLETYENTWSNQFTDIGFNNRLFIVPGVGTRKSPIPPTIPYEDKIPIINDISRLFGEIGNNHSPLIITPQALHLYEDWYFARESDTYSKRLDTYALRLMPILAVNEFKFKIDKEIVEKVLALVDWQYEVRSAHDPVDAEGTIAKLEDRIRRVLISKPMTISDLKRRVHYHRYGVYNFQTSLANLLKFGDIVIRDGKYFPNTTINPSDIATIQNFVKACCFIHREVETIVSHLYRKYKQWSREVNLHPVSMTAFIIILEKIGFIKQDSGQITFTGITVKSDAFTVIEG